MNKNKKRILIIDDGADSQHLHKMMLNANGYSVQCTSNGQAALSLLHNSARMPDLILLDVRMPVMDGYSFRRLQCQDLKFKDIPVVVITGDSDTAKISEDMLFPIKVICKPLHYKSFIEVISSSILATA